MKNYYEILEVNENASKEVIDKAYKVLAKKYHPDLQEEKNKKAAEEKIKSLNEAYDAKIARLKQEEENRKQVEHQNYVNNISNVYARQYTNIQREAEKHNAMNKQFKKEYNKELRKLRLQGFIRKVIDFWGIAVFIAVCAAFALICFIIYKIPATNRWLQNLYENNIIIKAIVDAIS